MYTVDSTAKKMPQKKPLRGKGKGKTPAAILASGKRKSMIRSLTTGLGAPSSAARSKQTKSVTGNEGKLEKGRMALCTTLIRG